MDGEKIRVFVIEENQLFCEGLRHLFGDMEHFEIKIEICSPQSCIPQIAKFKPDVLLFRYPHNASHLRDFLKQLLHTSPTTKPLLYDTSLTELQHLELVHQGVRGFLPQDTNAEKLLSAIRCLAKGEFWMNRKITARLLSSTLANVNASQSPPKRKASDLTVREKEVLSLLTKGLNNNDIASQLFISDTTVKCHLNRIFKKIGVNNRYEAIVFSLNASGNGSLAEFTYPQESVEAF